jgi:integral membrane protein (TIGR01906 family)
METTNTAKVEKSTATGQPVRSAARWTGLMRIVVTVMLPVLLTLISVRLVMTEPFLRFEYNRSAFPEDRYGFTRAERLFYAPYALEYLFNDADITYLSALTFDDGTPLFNERELQHMADVKIVTRAAFNLMFIGLLLLAAFVTLLWRFRPYRMAIRRAVIAGSTLTLMIIFTIVLTAISTWDTFFTTFHNLFFESGTWRFAYSDTLIRLFPEQFWFDASLVVGGATVLFALALLAGAWFAERKERQSVEAGA